MQQEADLQGVTLPGKVGMATSMACLPVLLCILPLWLLLLLLGPIAFLALYWRKSARLQHVPTACEAGANGAPSERASHAEPSGPSASQSSKSAQQPCKGKAGGSSTSLSKEPSQGSSTSACSSCSQPNTAAGDSRAAGQEVCTHIRHQAGSVQQAGSMAGMEGMHGSVAWHPSMIVPMFDLHTPAHGASASALFVFAEQPQDGGQAAGAEGGVENEPAALRGLLLLQDRTAEQGESTALLPKPPSVLDLGAIIGSGGFGSAYLAQLAGLGPVAVKVMRHAPKDRLAMLARCEGWLGLQCRHPNIVRTFAFFTHGEKAAPASPSPPPAVAQVPDHSATEGVDLEVHTSGFMGWLSTGGCCTQGSTVMDTQQLQGALNMCLMTSPDDISAHGSNGGRGEGADGGLWGMGQARPSTSSSRFILRRQDLAELQSVDSFENRSMWGGFACMLTPTSALTSQPRAQQLAPKQAPKDTVQHETWIVQELAEYGTLVEYLSTQTHLHHLSAPWGSGKVMAKALQALAEVASGLGYMHSQGWAHADVKASNILMCSRSESDGEVQAHASASGVIAKLGDLGLACPIDQGEGKRGTCSHMAPEIFQGSPCSAQGDTYAFGITMWEAMALAAPYACAKQETLALAVQQGRRPRWPMGFVEDATTEGATNAGLSTSLWGDAAPHLQQVRLAYRALAERCWAADPGVRPCMSRLEEELLGLAATLQCSGSTRVALEAKLHLGQQSTWSTENMCDNNGVPMRCRAGTERGPYDE